MNIKEYLGKHKIIEIGATLPEYISCEIIVDNPTELVQVVLSSNAFIAEIRWWEYASITAGATLGYGGPRDPNNPEKFFAETDIFESFNKLSTTSEYLQYLEKILEMYHNVDLLPAFDIKHKKHKKHRGRFA